MWEKPPKTTNTPHAKGFSTQKPEKNNSICANLKKPGAHQTMANTKPDEHIKLRVIFHTIGISCVAGAIFLQVLVFISIASQGFFMGTETNQSILFAEIIITIFCVTYFIYLAITKLLSVLGLRTQ